MKKNTPKIVLAVSSALFLVGGLLLAEAKAYQPAREASAADFTYQEGRDGFWLRESGNLDVAFTIDYTYDDDSGDTYDGYDQACGATKYWTVYLLDKTTEFNYYPNHKLMDGGNGRSRDRAEYYFPTVGADVITHGAETWTITVEKEATAYQCKDTEDPTEENLCGPDQDTGKTFNEVYNEQNWVVCIGPMFRMWWGTGNYSCPIDYYVGRMKEVDPSIDPDPTPTPTPTPTPSGGGSAKAGLPGGAIAGIIIGSVVLVTGGAFALGFFVFNKWIIVDNKAVRAFKTGKKDEQVRLHTMKLQKQHRVKEEVFDTKKDAEDFLNKSKK